MTAEEQIYDAVRRGDLDAAVMRIHELVAPSVRGQARGLDPADVDDVIQDTTLTLLEKFKRPAGEPIENVKGFAVKIAKCRITDTFRRKKPRGATPEDLVSTSWSPERHAIYAEVIDRCVRAFEGLDPDEQAVIEARYFRWDVHSIEDAAVILGRSVDWVRRRLKRAQKKIIEAALEEGARCPDSRDLRAAVELLFENDGWPVGGGEAK